MKMMRAAVAAMVGAAALACAGAASATTVLHLTQSTAFGSGDFGTVSYNVVSSTDIQFTVQLNPGFELVDTGSHHLFTANIDGSISGISLTPASGFGFATGAITNSPFSGFNFALNCGSPACGNGGSGPYPAEPFTFDVFGTGLNISSPSFAVDAWRDGTTGTIATGGGGGAVPEPTSWLLMIAGFGGLGAMLRRRRQTLAVA